MRQRTEICNMYGENVFFLSTSITDKCIKTTNAQTRTQNRRSKQQHCRQDAADNTTRARRN